MTHDELARTALGHFSSPEEATNHDAGAYHSPKPVEASHFGDSACNGKLALEEALEDDDAFAVLEWQQEVETCGDVNWFELEAGNVQLLEWKLDVCECQLAKKKRVAEVGKRVE